MLHRLHVSEGQSVVLSVQEIGFGMRRIGPNGQICNKDETGLQKTTCRSAFTRVSFVASLDSCPRLSITYIVCDNIDATGSIVFTFHGQLAQ